jgi:hypothetical protein
MDIPVAARALSFLRAGIVCLIALYARPSWSQQVDCLAAAPPVAAVGMRVLVITADGKEAVLPAIQQTLDYVGIPYDTWVAAEQVLTSANLCATVGSSGQANYQAVLLTTGNLGFLDPTTNTYRSAFTADEWTLLWSYEAKYGVRQVTAYTIGGGWPDTYGLNPPSAAIDTTSSPLTVTLTSASPPGSSDPDGQQLFSYLNPTATLVIQDAYTYLSTPASSAVTPLLVDAQGDALASIYDYPDGRQNLAVTADGNAYLLHSQAIFYGIVNWATKGLFIGQRKVYMSPQPDDVLNDDDVWNPVQLTDQAGQTYRMTAADYQTFISWQAAENAKFAGNQIQLSIPFNGVGASSVDFDPSELFPVTKDDLTPVIKAQSDAFTWLSHTYDHMELDAATYAQTMAELTKNDVVAQRTLGLNNYYRNAMITPSVSGLNNPAALQALSDYGIRYIVSDTSKFCGNRDTTPRPCPTPNIGVYNDLQPDILMVPRYPSNLYYNVYSPDQWTSEYNFIYESYWGRDLTTAQILDQESNIWLHYLMTYDLRPVMFHQPNLVAYDGTHSLLGDLMDATLTKYAALFNLPVQSLRLDQIGDLMIERMNLNAALSLASGSALAARIVPGTGSSSIVITNPTTSAVVVPITGVSAANGSVETYGGQPISRVTVPANGGTITITGAPAW